MLLSVIASVAVAAAPAAPTYRVASPGLSYVNLDDKTGDSFLDYFTQQLSIAGGFQVSTKAEIAALLGMERQRQLMGCAETSGNACVAELADALGADALVTGSLAKTTSGYLINIKVIAAKDARSLDIFSTRVKSDDALIDFLGESAKRLAADLRGELSPGPLGATRKPGLTPEAPQPVEEVSSALPRSRL